MLQPRAIRLRLDDIHPAAAQLKNVLRCRAVHCIQLLQCPTGFSHSFCASRPIRFYREVVWLAPTLEGVFPFAPLRVYRLSDFKLKLRGESLIGAAPRHNRSFRRYLRGVSGLL